MKNMKKLVSSVLALTLLAGSAVSMSCSAAGSAKRGQKSTASWYSRAWNWAFGKKSEDEKVDASAMTGVPGVIDKYNESNPDSYYRVKDQIRKLREQLNRVGEEEGKEELIAELNKIEENIETRRDLSNPGLINLIKEHVQKLLNSIKNKALSYGLKGLIITGIVTVCHFFGLSGMWYLLKGAWWILSFLPKSVLVGLGVYAGKKLF